MSASDQTLDIENCTVAYNLTLGRRNAAGINVNKTIVWIYTLTGALVGLASMITVARASTAQPTAGISLELDIIAACIIGG